MAGAYLSADIEICRRRNHSFRTAWSDKTPMRVNLICVTCTEATPGKTVYVAYGTDIGSFGQWRRRPVEAEEQERD